jgi:hypothetical protein
MLLRTVSVTNKRDGGDGRVFEIGGGTELTVALPLATW